MVSVRMAEQAAVIVPAMVMPGVVMPGVRSVVICLTTMRTVVACGLVTPGPRVHSLTVIMSMRGVTVGAMVMYVMAMGAMITRSVVMPATITLRVGVRVRTMVMTPVRMIRLEPVRMVLGTMVIVVVELFRLGSFHRLDDP
jgi:hypothetical protein